MGCFGAVTVVRLPATLPRRSVGRCHSRVALLAIVCALSSSLANCAGGQSLRLSRSIGASDCSRAGIDSLIPRVIFLRGGGGGGVSGGGAAKRSSRVLRSATSKFAGGGSKGVISSDTAMDPGEPLPQRRRKNRNAAQPIQDSEGGGGNIAGGSASGGGQRQDVVAHGWQAGLAVAPEAATAAAGGDGDGDGDSRQREESEGESEGEWFPGRTVLESLPLIP